MTLTVLTYNTLFAGRDGGADVRAKAQVQLVMELRPDVFLMQEAKGFDSNGSAWLYALERQTDMRSFLVIAPRTGQNVAIFIREPLRVLSFETDGANCHHALATLTRKRRAAPSFLDPHGGRVGEPTLGALRVTVPGSEEPVTFISAHLCPNSPEVCRREAAYIAMQAAPEKLTLITGDFNSASPHDPEPEDWPTLAPHHRGRYMADDLQGLDRSVLARLEAAGWVDVGHQLDAEATPTVPAAACRDIEFATMRCDVQLAPRRWQLRSAATRSSAMQSPTRHRTTTRCWPLSI